MKPELVAAELFTDSARAIIEALGMVAENQHRLSTGRSIAYGEDAFENVIVRNGLHQNAVIIRRESVSGS